MKKTLWLFALVAVLVGTGLVATTAQAADKTTYINQSFQSMLDRDPTSADLAYWLAKSDSALGTLGSSGYQGVRNYIKDNASAERTTVITSIYNRALKRDPRTDELSLQLGGTVTNNLREALFSSTERSLAIIDLYVNILGRAPSDSDLSFYYITRSDISDIADVLLASGERGLMVNIQLVPTCREYTSAELAMFNSEVPARTGAQWSYYYRDDIYSYVVGLVEAGQISCDVDYCTTYTVGTDNTIAGTITDATTGVAIDGTITATLKNYSTGATVSTATVASDGSFTLTGVTAGAYTFEVSVTGYTTYTTNLCISGSDQTVAATPSLSPTLGAGEVRVVLTWGEYPSDLDSHMTGPMSSDRFHVYYGDEDSTDSLVNLDVDDVTSYGPETVTIT